MSLRLSSVFKATALSAALTLSSPAQAQDGNVVLAAGSSDHGITLYGHTIHPLLNGEINPYYAENGFQKWNAIEGNLDRLFAGYGEQDLSLEAMCKGLHQASVHYRVLAEKHSFGLEEALEGAVNSHQGVIDFVKKHGHPDSGNSMSLHLAVSKALSGDDGAAYADLMKIYDGNEGGQIYVRNARQYSADARMTSELYGAAMQTPETCGPNGNAAPSPTSPSR